MDKQELSFDASNEIHETPETHDPLPDAKLPAQSVLTKKRYQELAESFREITGSDEATERCMDAVRRVMKFDPEQKRYTPELGKKILAYRQKKAADAGVSQYECFKGPEYYEKNKEVLNQRNTEYKRNRRKTGGTSECV